MIHIERPYKDDRMRELQSRSLLRWLSWHRRLKVWVFGTHRWTVLIVKDDDQPNSGPEARAALEQVHDEIASQS